MRSFLFCGESYSDMLTELDKPMAEDESKLMTYGAAAHWFQQPVYLLPCDDTGVTQLQIMAQPDYRQRLTRLALKGHYRPPPPDRPCWDALFQGQPFVLAADMELRRVDAVFHNTGQDVTAIWIFDPIRNWLAIFSGFGLKATAFFALMFCLVTKRGYRGAGQRWQEPSPTVSACAHQGEHSGADGRPRRGSPAG